MIAERKITTVIADADVAALSLLRGCAEEEAHLEVVAACRDGAAVLGACNDLAPDLIVMDTALPTLDGFAVLRYASSDAGPVAILTSKLQDHAARAYDVGAADFLLKPFTPERFRRAIQRATEQVQRGRMDGGAGDGLTVNREAAGATGTGSSQFADRLLVRHQGRIVVIPTASIRWVESAANYQRIVTTERTYMARMTIGRLRELLDPRVFARVHRRSIVNMNHVRSFRHVGAGAYLVTLDDGTDIRMSRFYSSAILSAYAC